VCSFDIWIECYAQLCHVLVLAYQFHMRIEEKIDWLSIGTFISVLHGEPCCMYTNCICMNEK